MLGSTVDSCYVSASHSQPSSSCEMQGGCRFMLNAQPPSVSAGFTQDFQILKLMMLDFSSVLSDVMLRAKWDGGADEEHIF